MRFSRSVRITLFVVLVTAVAGIVAKYIKIRHDLNPFDDRPFNASSWRAEESRKVRDGRAVMAGDLIRNHLSRGMTDVSVKELLGEPNKVWKPEHGKHHDTYEYDMGHAAWEIAGQHNVLRLKFDNSGLFENAEITRD